ncbi:hypothetical protein JHK87_016927 [Glycine soja]|nr:hypothetical protein JHK87_016927 [Glycine soja]
MPNNVDGSPPFPHGSRVKIRMDTPSGIKDSIPAWIKFAVQAPGGEIPYRGIYYDPLEEANQSPKSMKRNRLADVGIGHDTVMKSWSHILTNKDTGNMLDKQIIVSTF